MLTAVADRLAHLPAVAEVAAEGRLNFDQLRPLTEVASADSDEQWALDGPGCHPVSLERLAARTRRVTAEEADRAHRRRSVRATRISGGMSHISAVLTDDDHDIVMAELNRLAEQRRPSEGEQWEPLDRRGADALVDLCSAGLADDVDPDRATVVIHLPLDTLIEGSSSWAVLEDGTPIAPEVARRLVDDARIQAILTGHDGTPLDVFRLMRTVPPWLLRMLKERDQTCRFPGCESRRTLHAHHIQHWADGGPTDFANCCLLCRSHHRAVHEGGWALTG